MKYDAEDLISKCVQGRAARDVLRSIEEEIPDTNSLRMNLLKDLNRVGIRIKSSDIIADKTCIKVSVDEELMTSRCSEIMQIADAYSRTYHEIEVLIATLEAKPKL